MIYCCLFNDDKSQFLISILKGGIIVMPMMGAGLFSTSTGAPLMMVIGSLIGHLVYGAVLGAVSK